ncbi:very-long-chain 3-oxoacyl-CoA reductase-like [Ctenocephalides felis]|uniref:very-long-chain 3-oxoacyl-CoA reductase-like n=1 Tax=Ctenocephalides felis TaxID=7515 RepID=UPI000E6E4AAC|nr:very-long-chain 3-oxoacyl-CoA reductase-like [Ctenocephalides felis]
MLKPKINFKSMGKWAVVTGATDGVGKAYAMALAKEGMDIVLISRTMSKLESVAKEIETATNVQTKVIQADFTGGSEIFDSIEKQLLGLEIGVLINNVGMSYPYPEYFLNIKDGGKLFTDIVHCNVHSVTGMCRVVMPAMVERKKGVVINISSTAALIPSPMLAVYAASKAFIEKFSTDLASEYASDNIIIQSVAPGYVATNMSKIKKSAWMAPSPATFVDSALKTVGVTSHTTGYYPHALLVATVAMLKSICTPMAVKIIMGQMRNIRSRALKRVEVK